MSEPTVTEADEILAKATWDGLQRGDNVYVAYARTIAQARAAGRVEEREALLFLGDAWPLLSVLAKLADAVDHLMGDHGCDAHGWEETQTAANAARMMIRTIAARNQGGDNG